MSADTYVYVIGKFENGQFHAPCKIGMTQSVRERLHGIQTSCPFNVAVYAYLTLPSRRIARGIEESLHLTQRASRLRGEWFSFTPQRGWQLSQIAMFAALEVNLGDSFSVSEKTHIYRMATVLGAPAS